jgi:predicted house-cleaning noncanonical NTP pyrophosphatase (MazG superfamily)
VTGGRGDEHPAAFAKARAVRDGIPARIRSQGRACTVRTLPDDAYLRYLEYALIEELEAYLETKEPEALADLLEVIRRLARIRGLAWEELDALRVRRADAYGGYEGNTVLAPAAEEPERRMLLCTCERGDHVFEDE